MKLYTEEQLKQAVDKAMSMWLLSESNKEEILDSLTPLELPSDQEIENKIQDFEPISLEVEVGIRTGAKWMRDKLTKTKEK